MTDSSSDLQRSVYSALISDPALLGLLGDVRVFDDVPRQAEYPYVTFGQSTVRDFGTATERAEEHAFVVHVWSRAKGRQEAHRIMGAVRAALHDAPVALESHRLVNLRHEFSDTRREPDGETIHGIVRFRAVTEPLS